MMNAKEELAAVLRRYQDALNHSSVEEVMEVYAPDGVFMPQNFPSSIGEQAVRQAYQGIFAAITLQVQFHVAEILPLSDSWAMARTNSAGQSSVHATGQSSVEANQELFLFQRVDGEWKIARYCFSTTNPPRS